MSGGVNIKVISQSQSDTGVSSSLPLPRSMMPLSKMDPKQQFSNPSNPTMQYQHAAKRQASYSSSSVSSGPADLLRGAALKNHLLQQTACMYSHRSPAATERTDGTCSAYSSPQIPKRQIRRSKDTLDLRASTLNQKALRELQLRRTTNKNWTFGKYRLSVDNAAEEDTLCRLSANVQSSHGRGRLFHPKGANGNDLSGVSSAGMGNIQKEVRNIFHQHLGAADRHVSYKKPKSSPHTSNMPRRGSEPGRVNMAAVAPFRFRFQVHEGTDPTLEDLSDCSSDSMEVCCEELGGMLGNSVRGREGDLKMERTDSTKAYGQADGKGVGMAAKRAKSGVPQSSQRGELKVYRAGSSDGRIPLPSSLRKQRSMTNLAVLTDAEKKLHLYEPKWCDDMAKTGAGQSKMGKPKTAGGCSSAEGGKPKPFSPLAAPSALNKQSRIPRAPYAEVKPLSKAPEDGKSDDEILSSKAKAKKQGAGAGGESGSKGHGEEGGDKNFLKVDPELVVTVLGDLEQLLFSQILDPESQRKRTVQNVLDLRQNLEDTMTSLRGSQLSHSCMDSSNVGYDSDETNARSISSMSNRSSPLSWRHGQSSPRLQAGEAPSSTGGGYQGSKSCSQYTAQTMPARCSSRLNSTSRIELIEGLDDLKSGYLSDSDLLGKSLPDDDDNLANGWDESSSISSGLSDGEGDGSENLSSEEFNVSSSLNSLPTTPLGSRRNSSAMLRTDAEKRSLVESGLSWYSEDHKAGHKLDSGSYETGSLKTEAPSKWRKKPPSLSEDFGCKGELKKPQSLGQPGSFRKGRNPPVGVTSPITHTSQSTLKVAAPKCEKPMDKSRISLKTAGLQRSRSDAGKDHLGEYRKPPSGLVKPTAGASYGYKKHPTATGTATVMTAGGTTISSGSATLGKIPKSSGIPVKPVGGGTPSGRKNSFDASSEQCFLGPNTRNSIQYRSLPRPAKSSTFSVIGRPASRPLSGTIDPSLLSLKPMPMASTGPRMKEPSSCKMSSRSSTGPVNMTDREKEKERAKAKAVGADMDCGSLKAETRSSGESTMKLHGLRRTSSSKYPELSSPTTPRMMNTKSLGRPPSLAHLDKVNYNSLDSCVTIHDLPPKVPPYSKLQDLAGAHTSSRLTPSPAPVLHIDSSGSYTSESLSLGGSPLLYPKLSGMHRSMESLPLQMSVPPSSRFVRTETHDKEERGAGTWGAGSRTSLNLTDSLQADRNTLPKKGVERYGSSLSDTDGKPERRHSHTIVSMTESDSPPQLPSPTRPLHPSSGKAPLTNVVAPISSGTPRISRSNSIGPPGELACDLYGTSPLGSSISLADRPKSMMRCGSFREPGDDVHGSVLSLASNASSNYSANEERIQGEQIRKLRRELESSQEKVADLTMQLSANANLVAAFEQSLALMTARLQTLSVSSEQKIPSENEQLPGDIGVLEMSCGSKDSELTDLKDTIEVLRVKNSEAQEIIQVALNTPEIAPKEMQINRQNSSESISSLASTSSHSTCMPFMSHTCKTFGNSPSSLRSSFNKAFSKKGSKQSGPYADIEEISTPESSAPSSPKVVTGLRTELWEKERKLTDIRLEALSSAHQLEQLQDAMSSMQSTVENLKAENDHLKTGSLSPCPSPGPSSSVSQSSGLTALGSSSPRQSVAMHMPKSYSRGLSEGGSSDLYSADTLSLSSQRDDHRVRVVICVADLRVFKDQEVKQQDFFVGTVRVNGRMDWPMLDSAVSQAFK
ncbi:Neuron navigator 1, partial [Dissostichus eleginoides]